MTSYYNEGGDRRQNITIGWYMRLNESAISTISSTISSTELCWMLFVPHMVTAFWRLGHDRKFLHRHKIFSTLSPPILQYITYNSLKYLFQILEQRDKRQL